MSYTLIERRELAQTASSIVFSNIPQNYSDLFILVSARSSRTNDTLDDLAIAVNSITSGYSGRGFQGNGSVASSFSDDAAGTRFRYLSIITAATATSNTFSNSQVYISNYAGSANKSFSFESSTENNATAGYNRIAAGLLANTAAITSLTFTADNGSLVQGSSISIYGINRQQAIGKPKAIGGAITFANGYWVHTFTGSGTLSTQQNIDVEALIVAGGGGGGGRHAGGGGAGGYRSIPSMTLVGNTAYTVIVGSGGAGASDGTTVSSKAGSQGTTSTFNTISSAGGGGGAGAVTEAGGSGGSGGGGTYQGPVGSGNIPATSPSQGNNGGPGRFSGSTYVGGGGGGAGAVGGSASGSTAGSGGIGIGSSINGTTIFRAGGGGAGGWTPDTAGVGGLGGGGNGVGNAGSQAAQNGSTNTGGGGGGGGGEPSSGGNGGSGVVIIRYLA